MNGTHANGAGLSGGAAAVLKYLLLAVFVGALIFGSSGERMSDAPFEDVAQAVLAAARLDDMNEGDNQMIRRLYKLDPEEFEGALLYYPATNMGAEEILLVKLTDLSQQEAVRSAIEARLETQKNTFEGYGPEQLAMLERAVTEVRGNYVLLVVAEDPEPVRAAFADAL